MPRPKEHPGVENTPINSPNYLVAQRSKQQLDPEVREIVFYEESNPKSVVNLLSDAVREKALKLPTHLLGKTAKEIEEHFNPSWVDRQLRIAFWDEYFLTIDNNQKKMRMAAVYSHTCSREMFYQLVSNQVRLAWMLVPPEDYMLKMRSLLDMGLDRLQEILKLPLEMEKTNPKTGEKYKVINQKLVPEIIKAVAIIDNRVKGAVPMHMKIDATQKNMNVHAHIQAPPGYEPPRTHQDIDKELKAIEAEIKSLSPSEQVEIVDDIIDVESLDQSSENDR